MGKKRDERLMKKKVLSVVIPTHNRSSFLKKAIQNYKDFADEVEIIVINDGSKDEENEEYGKIVENDTVDYIIYGESRGASFARNCGLFRARGDYIWFVDDDDIPKKKTIKDVIEWAKKSSGRLLILPMELVYNEKKREIRIPEKDKNNFGYYRDKGHQVNTSCTVIKRQLIISIGGWDERLKAGQDTDLFLRLAKEEEPEILYTEPVEISVGHKNRISRKIISQQIAKLQFLKKNWKLLSTRRKLYYIGTFIIVENLVKETLRAFLPMEK